ncbi:MAG: PAS domain-containing protein [Leptospira sp.]|nr:PAS domain-containing protein [Leptospira sp.]
MNRNIMATESGVNPQELLKENQILRSKIKELEERELEIRKSELFLRENQVNIEHVLAEIPLVLYIYDLEEKKNVFINREVACFLGYTETEVQAMGSDVLLNLVHPEDLPYCLEHHSRLIYAEPKQVLQVKYRMRNSNGQWKWFSGSDTPFQKQPGSRTRYIIGCAQEIPE